MKNKIVNYMKTHPYISLYGSSSTIVSIGVGGTTGSVFASLIFFGICGIVLAMILAIVHD